MFKFSTHSRTIAASKIEKDEVKGFWWWFGGLACWGWATSTRTLLLVELREKWCQRRERFVYFGQFSADDIRLTPSFTASRLLSPNASCKSVKTRKSCVDAISEMHTAGETSIRAWDAPSAFPVCFPFCCSNFSRLRCVSNPGQMEARVRKKGMSVGRAKSGLRGREKVGEGRMETKDIIPDGPDAIT